MFVVEFIFLIYEHICDTYIYSVFLDLFLHSFILLITQLEFKVNIGMYQTVLSIEYMWKRLSKNSTYYK